MHSVPLSTSYRYLGSFLTRKIIQKHQLSPKLSSKTRPKAKIHDLPQWLTNINTFMYDNSLYREVHLGLCIQGCTDRVCIQGGTGMELYTSRYRYYSVYKQVQVLFCIQGGTGMALYTGRYRYGSVYRKVQVGFCIQGSTGMVLHTGRFRYCSVYRELQVWFCIQEGSGTSIH